MIYRKSIKQIQIYSVGSKTEKDLQFNESLQVPYKIKYDIFTGSL